MKKAPLIIIFLGILFASCGSSKKAQNAIESGDFSVAINIAMQKLRESKVKNSETYAPILKNAYDRAVLQKEAEVTTIKHLNSITTLKKIYRNYSLLDAWQYDVISVQPLYVAGKEILFNFNNYTDKINSSKRNLSDALYAQGMELMRGNKMQAREAFAVFESLDYLNGSYPKNITSLIQKAKNKGASHVFISLKNNLEYNALSQEEQEDLLNINTANSNNKWIIFHNSRNKKTSLDYEAIMMVDQLIFTPNQVNSELIKQEKRIKDGWEYVKDANGNVKKDDKGNDIKQDKIITVRAEIKMFQQLKTVTLEGGLYLKSLKTSRGDQQEEIIGEATFENVYAEYRGDARAIDQKHSNALKGKSVAFPADDQFVKSAIAHYKKQVQQLLNNLKI
ncbi:MAG: hypothetical protein JKY08_03415 [Flavobacteriaceae bacterium]|nr:hypothetical protein [Flavobacteriaceae bacterium]